MFFFTIALCVIKINPIYTVFNCVANEYQNVLFLQFIKSSKWPLDETLSSDVARREYARKFTKHHTVYLSMPEIQFS